MSKLKRSYNTFIPQITIKKVKNKYTTNYVDGFVISTYSMKYKL